jgi:hypothetical protein
MWPFVNFRQLKAKKRDSRPQRKNYINNISIGSYWTSECELEVRYYLGRLLQREFASGLKGNPSSKKLSFIYRNKRIVVADFYIRKFNNKLTMSIVSDSRIPLKKFQIYQKMVSLRYSCMLCDGCYMSEHSLCRKAQGSIQHKYGFFRTTTTY